MITHLGRKIAGQPLLITQLLYSASGAIPVLLAAFAMTPEHFTRFSFLILLVQVISGAVVTCIFRGAMMHYRKARDAHVRFSLALSVSVVCALVFAGGAYAFDVRELIPLVGISAVTIIVVLDEWLRHRAMTLDRRWDLVRADALRLVITLSVSLVLLVNDNAEVYFTLYGLAWLPSAIWLIVRLPRIREFCRFRDYRNLTGHLLVDFIVGQFMVILPLIVLGGLGQSQYLGGVRLAQTLLGPLNTVFAALTTNLFVDGVTDERHRDNREFIRLGRRLALRLALGGMVFVPTVVGIIWVTGISLRGVGNKEIIVGLVLVGALAICYNSSAIDAVVLRLVGFNRLATVGRVVLAIMSVAGFTSGYVVGGVDGSLIVGFLASSLANPLCFVLPASVAYRTVRLTGAEAQVATGESVSSVGRNRVQ